MTEDTKSPEYWGKRITEQWAKSQTLQAEARAMVRAVRKKSVGPEIETVEDPLARALIEGGHDIKRQVVCDGGRIDIYDSTTSEIIECKARGNASSISDAVNQLNRYRPHFFDPQLAVAVPRVEPDALWMVAALREIGIRIIEVEKGVGI